MLPPACLLIALPLLMPQPPNVGGGFDDPEVQPPIEDPSPPFPGDFEADPFDDPPAEGDAPAEGFADDPPPMADPADPDAALEAAEESVREIGEDVEAEIDAFADPAPRRDAPQPPMLDRFDDQQFGDETDAPLSLDPADPNVVVEEDPAVTVITDPEPNPLAELIRNPYDIYDLREHAAIPADCLLARQACLPCTRTVTTCVPCGCGGTQTETLPVPGVNPDAANNIADILYNRTPADPRLNYLMFVLRYREARYDEAFSYLEEAVKLEQARPIRGYGEFMEPIQGRARVYLERVRRLAGVAG